MAYATLTQTLTRTQRLRQLIEMERARPSGCRVRLLRLQTMLLKVQARLAAALATPATASLRMA